MLLVSMAMMLNKTEEEIDKLRDEQLNFQSDWFFTKYQNDCRQSYSRSK
jgi:hypothetical protein